jgi:butyrate kinase
MATNFPSSLDSFTNPTAVDTLDSPPHDTQHADANDAIEALEAKVGVNGSAVTTSHEYRINSIEELNTNAQVGTTYTLALTDDGKVVEMNNASANTLTVPPNSSVAFPVGSQILVLQTGAGQTTVAAGAGVTVNSKDGNLKLSAQWCAATLIKRATDVWVVVGDLSA